MKTYSLHQSLIGQLYFNISQLMVKRLHSPQEWFLNILQNSRARAIAVGAVGLMSLNIPTASADLPYVASGGRDALFDADWKFFLGQASGAEQPAFDDQGWRKLDLPHDWSIEDLAGGSDDSAATADPTAWSVPAGATPPAGVPLVIGPFNFTTSPGQASTGYTVGGEGWYRKTFTLGDTRRGDRMELRFDGVYEHSDVWINGTHLGNHPYGYTTFTFDLTPYLKRGDNVIAVRVRNLGRNSRWYSGSGIIRHVWLVKTGSVRIPFGGITITTPMVTGKKASVSSRVELQNTSDRRSRVMVLINVLDASGRRVAFGSESAKLDAGQLGQVDVALTVKQPNLWSLESPNLYRARIEVIADNRRTDSFDQPFGIRSVVIDPTRGLLVNGTPIKMRGANIHHDHGALGGATSDRAEFRRVEILKAAGFNAIRTAHNPPAPALLDACDQLGMLVYEEPFDMWQQPKSPDDYGLSFPDWWQRDIDSMVRRDRNHPSVVIWSIGNELYNFDFSTGFPIVTNFSPETGKPIADRIRLNDPTRVITEGGWAGQWVLMAQDAIATSKWDYLDLGDVHYQHDYSILHASRPDRALLNSESFPATMYEDWQLVINNPFAIGDFTWTGWDYLGESALGRPDLIPEGTVQGPDDIRQLPPLLPYPWFQANCGDIDLIGERKPQWHYRTVIWGDSNLEMAVERPAPAGQDQAAIAWGFYDELQSWTWGVPSGTLMKVRVYTSADEIQVLLNGAEIAVKRLTPADKMTTTFDVPYQPGTLTAIARRFGNEIARKEFTSVKAPYTLRLTPDARTIGKGRDSLAFVLVEVVDQHNRLVPDAVVQVSFTITGSGEIAGVANANPRNVDSFRKPKKFTYQGKAQLIARAIGKRGQMTINATAPGLAAARVNIRCQ